MIKYATNNDAEKVVSRWNGVPNSVEHIGNHGNSVFSFRNSKSELQILRFTDPSFRSYGEVVAELNFVNNLYHDSVPVAQGLATVDESLAFLTDCSSGSLICSSISYASGVEVQEGSIYWNPTFFKDWGQNLALIHKSSMKFQPKAHEPKRWQWDCENLITKAEKLIPTNDKASLDELHEVISLCKSLPKHAANFGLIHADHAPQNFRYDLSKQCITAFDFGNCCYHWFIADLAISLSTVRRKMNKEKIRESILEGYSSIVSLPNDLDNQINLFIRLRVVYFYLSRLNLWSENRTSEQQKNLDLYKTMVHAKLGWNLAH